MNATVECPDMADMLNRALIKKLRVDAEMTQAQAAVAAGVRDSARWWSDIENPKPDRRNAVTLATLYAVAKALKCDPCDLLLKPKGRGKRK